MMPSNNNISLGLAPMLAVTNFATRLWFSQTSEPEFTTAPFLRVTKCNDPNKIHHLYAPELEEAKDFVTYKLTPQLMVNNPQDFIRFAESFLLRTPHVDLNCACPSPTAVFRGGGSSLLKSADKFADFTGTLCKQLGPNKISIKMRIGFLDENEFSQLLSIISSLPFASVAIHGRTAKENFSGKARWEIIESARKILAFPVVGCGDIFSAAIFKEKRHLAPSVNSFLFGRGLLRNPWLLNELRTGRPVQLSCNCLTFSLACFACLQNLFRENPLLLIKAVKKGFFRCFCGTDESSWEKLYYKLITLATGKPLCPKEFEPGNVCLSLVKMIWQKLSTSLPEEFLSLAPLHAKSFAGFLGSIEKIHQINSNSYGDGKYTLSHNLSLDSYSKTQLDKRQ